MKPATALPWSYEQIGVSDAGPNGVDVFDIGPCDHEGAMRVRVATVAGDDAAYLVHCANSYPRLVQALREILAHIEADGNTGVRINDCSKGSPALKAAANLLRELGEIQ